MKIKIGKQYRFQAAHRLPNVGVAHKCHNLHGHTYQVKIEISGPLVPKYEWVEDYSFFDGWWQGCRSLLDHAYLNEIPGLQNPTAEIIAAWIFGRLNAELEAYRKSKKTAEGVTLERVLVSENESTWAEVSA